MNISKRGSEPSKPIEKKVVNLSESQKKLYRESLGAVIPLGKYKGRLLSEIRETESWYYNWLWDEELLWKWGMMQLRTDAMRAPRHKYDKLYVGQGTIWLCIQEVAERASSWEVMEKWLTQDQVT